MTVKNEMVLKKLPLSVIEDWFNYYKEVGYEPKDFNIQTLKYLRLNDLLDEDNEFTPCETLLGCTDFKSFEEIFHYESICADDYMTIYETIQRKNWRIDFFDLYLFDNKYIALWKI